MKEPAKSTYFSQMPLNMNALMHEIIQKDRSKSGYKEFYKSQLT